MQQGNSMFTGLGVWAKNVRINGVMRTYPSNLGKVWVLC